MGLLRGGLIATLFGVVLFILIPVYVPRPGFIPGFAPPPDMWPRAITGLGLILGLLLIVFSFFKQVEVMADPESAAAIGGNTPLAVMLLRFVLAVAGFALYAVAIPVVGFLIASMLIFAAMLILTGYWRHKRAVSISIAVILPLLLFLFFSSALNTRFPAGSLIKALGF